VIGLFCGVAWGAWLQFQPVSRSAEKVKVEIPRGATLRTIAGRLKDAGLIRSAIAFELTARGLGHSEEMRAGEYELPRNLGPLEIIDRLERGAAEAQWFTIPEGKTLREVAMILQEQRLANATEFLRQAGRRPKAFGLDVDVPRPSIEGYVMPDSYKVPTKISEDRLIRFMLENWQTKALEPYRAQYAARGLPVDKIVIIASLIEREARVDGDRTLISSVIRNRLARKMPLQIDATVLYALGRHKEMVLFSDLKVDHPYNTYRNRGLPPGPICSPGVAAIEAALMPAETDYLYYVAKPDGSHIFTRTLQEHNAAVRRARQMREAAAPAAAAPAS
jgi:UPF0755 protein